jgi:hypothetical protein
MSIAPPLGSIEFERLLDRLALDITDAAIFRKLHADLNSSINEYWREFSQSQTFWSLALQAFIETTLNRLSRVYVGHRDALSLGSLLEAIKNNQQLFPCPPDAVQLDCDIDSVRDGDPIVKKLVQLRGNVVAHINWNNIAENLRLGDRFALTFKEIDLLSARATAILNRYSVLFKRTHWSMNILGKDDFRTILEASRRDLKRRHAEVEEEIIRATRAVGLRRFAISIALFMARLRRLSRSV